VAQRPNASTSSDDEAPPPGWVRLGRLGRPFQLQGALHLQSSGPAADTVVRELAGAGAQVWLSGIGRIRLREVWRARGGVAVAFQGVYSPERAREHVHRELWVEPGAVRDEDDGVGVEFLDGAEVRVDGQPYGRVVEVVLGAQDLLVVEGPHGRRWVPWGAPYVTWDGTSVDVVDPPAGLLDDEG
jgi:ribosomal 30S subunit maturation factor RimM